MINSLLPIGGYQYNKDDFSFDEAWENLVRCFHERELVVCIAISESNDGKYINIEYHGISGKIFRGYLTQNRHLCSEYFIGKSFCVSIYKLNKREKTFIATHIPVEQEGKDQLSLLKPGDEISGIISYIDYGGAYAFVDVREGNIFFISAKNLFWRPVGCQNLNAFYSVGDYIVGTINFMEPAEKPQHPTIGALTCLNFEKNWTLETTGLSIGKVVKGIPKSEILSQNLYFFSYSQHVYIEFYSKENLVEQKEVEVIITEIDAENYLVKANLVLNDKDQQSNEDTAEENTSECITAEEGKDSPKTGSLFDIEIKATVSPFRVHKDDETEFESTPNGNKAFYEIQDRIRNGQINKLHFSILKAINLFVFCTSKQIMAWLYCNKELPKGISQNKINNKLETMSKLGMIDRVRFKSSEGEGIYRIYFLNKNGERLLAGYLSTKHTSYQEALLVTPSSEIKKNLATNQIILAFKEKFDFLRSINIRKVLMADHATPIRTSAVLIFSNGIFLIETRRRYWGWKEDIVEKMKRYSLLFENYQKGVLPTDSQFLLKKQIYLLIVCEDMENALEIRDLFWSHTMYPFLFFTYDLLIFQKDVNYSIFRFEGVEREPIYYNLTELLCFNLYRTEFEQHNNEVKDDDELVNFRKCFERGYFLGLEYLQKHDTALLKKMISEEYEDIYCVGGDGTYCPVYPEEEQYYIYLLYLINHNFVKNLSAELNEKNLQVISESSKETVRIELISELEYSTPDDLEFAVEKVLKTIYKWCEKNLNNFQHVDAPFQIIKHPLKQTSGMQYGYDVGMNFRYHGKTYHVGFECKNYKKLRKKIDEGKDSRLTVNGYAYNLLEFFMNAEEDVYNIWILICPFGDLQNDFHEKLFEKWNKTNPFMKICCFCSSQAGITCEEFLSLDEGAYTSVYRRDPIITTEDEKIKLIERIFYTIVDHEDLEESFENKLSKYPFYGDFFDTNYQMTLKTLQGDDVSEQIFEKLRKNQNVFLIGEYGSGKTFMTYYIVRTILEHQEVYPYFPLWFQLSACSGELTYGNIEAEAREFMENSMKNYAHFPCDLTMRGRQRILIILDGLDEIISGLAESDLKLSLLENICRMLNSKYGNHPLFLITSREIDFKSCMGGQQRIPFFDKFSKIVIGDCCIEDAIQKLQNVENQTGWEQEKAGFSITQNNKLMSIAQKPLYFGFVREFILDQDFVEDYSDELDVLKAIVKKSVKYYTENNTNLTLKEDNVIKQLYDWASEISIQMTLGGSSEVPIYQWNLLPESKNNVIRLRKIKEHVYGLRFYHNAIREFLVAEDLYKKISDCAVSNNMFINRVKEQLKQLELTPEMLAFFSKLVKKNIQTSTQVAAQILGMLQSANQPSEQRLGSNLFSMLYHLQNQLTNLDLNGIYTNNMYLWNCSLKKINLQNAHMANLRLFDVNMEDIDFRGADLTGLIMGQHDKILYVQHRKRVNGFSIYVLYESQQLVEYQFLEYNSWEKYEIVYHANIENHKYDGFCPLDNNILFYSEKGMFFESDTEKFYTVSCDSRLLQITPSFFLVEQNHCIKLVMHSLKYQENSIVSLMPNEGNMLYVIDHKGYLYVDEERLFLKQGEDCYFITYISSDFECFTAIRTRESYDIKIYIKYSNDIQIIKYSSLKKESESSAKKLPKCLAFVKMNIVKEDVLYGISDQMVYLFDLSAVDIQLYDLHINVNCKRLLLEDFDSTNRVQGKKEYELLKKANDHGQNEAFAGTEFSQS